MDKEVRLYWALYFSTLAGWQQHPGKLGEHGRKLSLKECADYADIMMDQMLVRFPELRKEVE